MKNEFASLSQQKIMKSLDWAYDKAVNGVPGLDSAQDMANNYLQGEETLTEKVNSLIRWQNTKAGTSGFITGLGGLLTLPVALPANITTVLYVQIRMIAAIAIMGGYDVRLLMLLQRTLLVMWHETRLLLMKNENHYEIYKY